VAFPAPTNETMTFQLQRYNFSGMEEIQFQNLLSQKLKVAILPLDLLCSGLVPNSGAILTTEKSHKKKPDGLFPKYY
jgi:hypothetical protein